MKKSINILIVGYGSIGKRHARILNELGHNVTVVSRREIKYPRKYNDLRVAIMKENPEYVVVANETSGHEEILRQLKDLRYNKKILVEKPLFHHITNEAFDFQELYVGYNLRFHPIVQMLYDYLNNEKILSVHAYVGQYLPNWRPNTDYSKSYSSTILKGGGVLRDLSHELDYLQLLLGKWKNMASIGGKYSELSIESDDTYSLIYETERCPLISLQMNYLDFITQRLIIINTSDKTYKADFIHNTLQINDKVISFKTNKDDTYISQHLAIINGDTSHLCSFDEGAEIVKMIDVAENSSKERFWIANE